MSYEYVSERYARQLHDLGRLLVVGEDMEAVREQEQVAALRSAIRLVLKAEGCPPDESYPACANCPGCGYEANPDGDLPPAA